MNSDDMVTRFEKILGGKTEVLLQIGPKFDSYKARAKTRNMDFKLSFSQFDALVKDDCHYCKVSVKDKPMGIDRVDSKKGYTLFNSVSCCWTCNRAKSDMNYVDFKNYLKRFK